jgi:large repetitive protein
VVLTPARGSTLNNNRPTYTGLAEAGSTVTVWLEGTAVGCTTANASGEWALMQPVALVDGPHRVMATAAGSNTRAESYANTFTVDATPPTAPVVLTPAYGSTLNNNRPTYSGQAEAESTVTVWVDETEAGIARTNAAGDWSFTPATGLSEGFHQAVAIATDWAGNASAASPAQYILLDTVAPAAPEVHSPQAIVNTQEPTIGGTAEEESTVRVWLDGMEVGTAQADETGAWHLTPATALADGRHLAVAIAMDAAGNTSRPSAEYAFTIPKGNYRWSCATAPGFPVTWALLALGWSLRRRPPRSPRGGTQSEREEPART